MCSDEAKTGEPMSAGASCAMKNYPAAPHNAPTAAGAVGDNMFVCRSCRLVTVLVAAPSLAGYVLARCAQPSARPLCAEA